MALTLQLGQSVFELCLPSFQIHVLPTLLALCLVLITSFEFLYLPGHCNSPLLFPDNPTLIISRSPLGQNPHLVIIRPSKGSAFSLYEVLTVAGAPVWDLTECPLVWVPSPATVLLFTSK